MDLDVNQLRDLARRDNPAAVVQLIELYYARIYAFLRRRTGNDADAADLTQRTFGRVQQSLSSFAGRSSVASWIHGIAYHTYIDWRRAERRPEPQSDEWWQTCPAPDPAPDELVAHADLARRLYACVDGLEPEQRDAIHLHYYQGLTLQETADTLDVSASTIKNRLREALDKLQRRLAGDRATTSPSSPLRV
jgi:RNA polymerase sigma-70 factor (ECF subfamily)